MNSILQIYFLLNLIFLTRLITIIKKLWRTILIHITIPYLYIHLGTYYNRIGRKEEADSIFNFIYENYKNETIVNAAAIQLKKPLINLNYDPADELYVNAEKKLLEKKYSESVKKFYGIFIDYPKSPLAPKALYAGGWILENELRLLDSAASVL